MVLYFFIVLMVYRSQGVCRALGTKAAERILRPQGPLQASRTAYFQGPEINFGKVLVVYFMRLLWVSLPPAPSRRPCILLLKNSLILSYIFKGA